MKIRLRRAEIKDAADWNLVKLQGYDVPGMFGGDYILEYWKPAPRAAELGGLNNEENGEWLPVEIVE